MSALRSLSEGKQTLPNVDYKRPCTMTTPSGTGVLLKGKTLSPLQRSKCDKCGFRGRKFYLCALLPNGVRWRDAHGAIWRFRNDAHALEPALRDLGGDWVADQFE
jgi:hypothetical protein